MKNGEFDVEKGVGYAEHINTLIIHEAPSKEKSKSIPNLTSLPAINPDFIGRKAELEEITKQLQEDHMIYVVNGIGGVGKSELSYKYLHENRDKYKKIAFIEITKDTSSLEELFLIKLKDSLQLSDDDVLDTIIKKLQGLPAKNLLLLDNLKNREDFEKIKALNTNFDLLITTRIKDIGSTKNRLNLDTLNNEDAKALFLSIYDKDEHIEDILEYLDNHPLFITLTTKSLEQEYVSLEELRESIKNGTFAKIDSKDDKTFQEHLQDTFEKQFKDEDNDELKELLQLLSIFPSIEIEFEILEKSLQLKKLKVKLQKLVSRGWLSKKDNSYKLHQIIKTFMLSTHPIEYEKVTFILDNIATYIDPDDSTLIANQLNGYIPLIDSILSLYKDKKDGYIAGVLDSMTYLYYSLAQYDSSLVFQQRSFDMKRELFGDESKEVAKSYNLLGVIYDSKGEYDNALPLFEKGLKIRKKVLGGNSPDTAASYNNLAGLYKSKREYDKALPLFEKALKIRKEVLGENDTDTAASYNNLAGLYRSKGKYDKALPLYEKALNIKEKVLGKNHPDTALSYNNLSTLYDSKREYDKALPLYEKALNINEEVLGKNHPNTAASYNNLAVLYDSKREYDKALPLFKQALKIREEVLGENHPDTATSYNNIGLFYKDLKECKKAKEFLTKAIVTLEQLCYIHPKLYITKQALKSVENSIKKQQKAGYKKKGKFCKDM